MQLWWPRRKLVSRRLKTFRSKSECDKNTKNFWSFFSQKGSYGQIKSSFDSPNKVFFSTRLVVFYSLFVNVKKTKTIAEKHFSPKRSFGNKNCSFEKPAKKVDKRLQTCNSKSEQDIKITILSEKFMVFNFVLWTSGALFWQPYEFVPAESWKFLTEYPRKLKK